MHIYYNNINIIIMLLNHITMNYGAIRLLYYYLLQN